MVDIFGRFRLAPYSLLVGESIDVYLDSNTTISQDLLTDTQRSYPFFTVEQMLLISQGTYLLLQLSVRPLK